MGAIADPVGVGAVANLSSAIVTGSVSEVAGPLQISEFAVTLDTMTSIPFNTVR